MADERNYYVLCENNCKFPAMTKEQILAAIEQAVSTGEIKNVDTGFVTKIKEQNAGAPLSFWVGTTAQYNAIAEKAANCFYIITDDTTFEDMKQAIDEFRVDVENFAEIIGKNGAVLCNELISNTDTNPYYEPVTIKNITKYTLVRVYFEGDEKDVYAEALCTVDVNGGNFAIKGTGSGRVYVTAEGYCKTAFYTVYMAGTCAANGDGKVTTNISEGFIPNSVAGRNGGITKIIGIM